MKGYFLTLAVAALISTNAFAASPAASASPVPSLNDTDYSITKSLPTKGWVAHQIDTTLGERGESVTVFGKSSAAVYFFIKNSAGATIDKFRLGFSGADAAAKAEGCSRKFDEVATGGGQFFMSVDSKGRNVMCAHRK